MASFLIGLLKEAGPVTVNSTNGALQLPGTGSAVTNASVWDYFGDARASVPAGNDAEISALYELGVTKGASAAAVQDDTKAPLDTNYEPFGTVNRGEMAEFITRALAHTSARPAGVSAQYDGVSDVVVSYRDENFAPEANVLVDVFTLDTNALDLAFSATGSCSAEVGKVSSTGDHLCEIDGADLLTVSNGDVSVPLGTENNAPVKGGTTVWAWTGETGDKLGSDTDRYQLDIPEGAAKRTATLVRITNDNSGKAHLGSSVLYTVQLEDANGPVAFGHDTNNPRPAQFLVTVSTYAIVTGGVRNPQGASVATTIPLTTDADGKATFPVSGLPDTAPNIPADKYVVDVYIQPAPTVGNAPPHSAVSGEETYFFGTAPNARALTQANNIIAVNATTASAIGTGLVFSTEPGISGTDDATRAADVTVSLTPAADYVAAAARGASTRATVTVTDQYGDPVPGAKVTLTSSVGRAADGTGASSLPAAANTAAVREFSVSRADGSYTFSYTRTGAGAGSEDLTATLVAYDHDGDGCSATDITTSDHRCNPDGTAPITKPAVTEPVQWAQDSTASFSAATIMAFDKDTNTIFVTNGGTVEVVYYDSNDRFDVGGSSSTYTLFERNLTTTAASSTAALEWVRDATRSGSRAVHTFRLTT